MGHLAQHNTPVIAGKDGSTQRQGDQDDEGGEVEQTKTRSRRRKAALGHAGHTHTHVFQSPHSLTLVLQEQDAHERTLKPNGVACGAP